jgi:hypothetical protein
MAGAGDVDHVQIVPLDQAIQVDINEVQTRRRSPMTQKARLNVLLRQRFLEQRIVVEIDLSDRQVVGSAPVRIEPLLFLIREGVCHRHLRQIAPFRFRIP